MGTYAAELATEPAPAGGPGPGVADAPPHRHGGDAAGAAGRPWIVGRVGGPEDRLRLLCLPQAGGSTGSFAPWRLAMGLPGFELATVELPGRGVGSGETMPDTLEELADAVIDGVRDELDMPYALFGHSFGALLGHRIAVRVAERGLRPPSALVVSASRAPHAPVRKRVSHLDDAGLLAWLEGFGGFPPELSRYPAYLTYALRTVRRDLALVEEYRPAAAVPVGCPLHVFGGAEDPLVSGEQLELWRECAAGGFTSRLLPGGHDYLFTGAAAMTAALAATLL
ncbi:thioesterase II family protein [Streptomyces sp. NPDC085479]|uniref:thioesterase II family protein n=1 Tax=Streptomyces sp. NPDC085479 TaxID=3365726 RepID=UPI0037D29091